MIHAVIVDDEKKGREILHELLINYCPNVAVTGTAASVKEAYELIIAEKPDLVFLDIEMPHQSGFDLIEQFDEIDFEIVFTTAYDQYAIKAIRYSALDYLLKPIDIEDLKNTLLRVEKMRQYRFRNKVNIDTLIENLKGKQFQKILLPCTDGFMLVDVNKIICCTANGNYSIVIMEDSATNILVAKTLKYFEEILSPDLFFRIHNSTLINLNYVKKYSKEDGGYVVMKNDSRFEISRRKKIEFMQKILSM
jgi:two-component system, LytTR family, response regulator